MAALVPRAEALSALNASVVMFFMSVLFLPFLGSKQPLPEETLNETPIIGVLVQEVRDPAPGRFSYIAASYVKFLEAGGARVVPVPVYQTKEYYTKLFNSINGIFFPGGQTSIKESGYRTSANIFYELAVEANQRGDYFPVWGTCLGFELLFFLASETTKLAITDTFGVAMPLNFTSKAKGSRMFKDFPAQLIKDLSSQPLASHSHDFALAMSTYDNNEELKNFYKVLSTNTDGKTEFASTVEAYNYPFYGTQWHPEKNAFEWTRPYIPHSRSAMKTTFNMAEFFVNEARKNFHKFESKELEEDALIYNYVPMYTGREWPFEQSYFF